MRLVIFGATGRIGRQVVRSAAHRGHEVLAFAHEPDPITGPGLTGAQSAGTQAAPRITSPLTAGPPGNLAVVTGDVFAPETLRGPIDSADAVVFAVGSPGRGPTRVRSAGIAAVTRAMRASGVSRLVAVSPSAAVISPRAPVTRKLALRYFVHKLYRNPFLDVERMEDELRHTDLSWSVVRAAPLRDWPASGRYRVVPDGQLRHEWPVSVADLADFIVGHAVSEAAGHDTVTVTGTGARRPRHDEPGQQDGPERSPARKVQEEGQAR